MPITTTSAAVKRVIMPSSTLLPTPLPAIKPMRCPRPMVRNELMARTPTSRTPSIGARCSGFRRSPRKATKTDGSISSPPSSGRPSPSTTLPSSASPTPTRAVCVTTLTPVPGNRPCTVARGINMTSSPLNPTTSQVTPSPCSAMTSQYAPSGARTPRAPSNIPVTRVSTPQTPGGGSSTVESL